MDIHTKGNANGPAAVNYTVSDSKGGHPATSLNFNITPVNDAPALSGTKSVLPNGKEDTVYTIKESDLLKGYRDVDGDPISVDNLQSSTGQLQKVSNGTWALTPEANFNGRVTLNYQVIDGNDGSLAASQEFSLTPVNDAPVVSGAIDLGEMDEDGCHTITKEQLLATASDVDGDALFIKNLKLSQGEGALTKNDDGTWTFKPSQDWNGAVRFAYEVSDRTVEAQIVRPGFPSIALPFALLRDGNQRGVNTNPDLGYSPVGYKWQTSASTGSVTSYTMWGSNDALISALKSINRSSLLS